MSKKKIKIIYVLPTLDPGGAEKFIVDLIKNLDRNQFEIKIVLFRHEGFFTEELKKIGIPIISLKKKFKVDPINFYQLYQILKSEKADIIHTELGGDIYGRIIAKMIGTKIIISTEQNVNPDEKPWITWLKKFSAQFADRVICISKAVQKDSLERYLIPKEKMPIIYNGIEIENFFHERDYQKNTLESIKICSLGRLMPQKGFRYLIEAFTLIKDKNFICQIIGEGELRPELEQLIKQNNLENKVKLIGLRKSVEVSNIFKSSDLFVLPSVWEGLGIAVIEAGLTGLPIVASNVDGIKEVISSEKEGILVEPKNSQELAKQLSYVIDNINTEKIKEMGKSLQQSIKARFSISVIARQYQDLYLQLVKEKGREE